MVLGGGLERNTELPQGMGLETEVGRKELERERMERLNGARRRGHSVEFGVLREMRQLNMAEMKWVKSTGE